MQGRLRIETSERAAAELEQLKELERRFCAASDPAAKRPLARDIIRLRMALTDYDLRHQIREVHDQRVQVLPATSGGERFS
jgi:hypothetical protein